jgi:hypothetical protein
MSKKDGKIHIKGKKRENLKPGQAPIVRVTADAYNKLVEITNESCDSMSNIASQLILQGSELIVYDREDE